MSMLDKILRRGAQVPVPNTSQQFSLARILNQNAYDTDPIKTDEDALKAYSGWVYACVSTISQDVRSSDWNVWEKTGSARDDWKPLDSTRLPPVLLRPTAATTWGDLIELTQVHLDLAGRAFWHLITDGSAGGRVVGIQNLNPDWISKAVYNPGRTQVIGWELAATGATREILPAEDVVMFRYPDPINPTGGISPIRAVAMSADMDTYARAYAASHLRNHAQPTGILTTENELTREQASLLADSWQESHAGRNRIQVLGKGAQYQTISAHLKDLEFLNLARVSRDQILAAYHMPASKLGLVEDASRANGEEADRVYSSLCLGPRLRRYHEPITMRVLPRIGLDSTRYAFEFDPVEVADKTFDRDSAQAAFQAGAITLDEYRERIGFAPEANGNGAVYFVPAGLTVQENPESIVDSDALVGEAGIGESVAPEVVLNGAQVASLVSVVEAMMNGTLPYASALEIVQSAFGMSEEKARRILGPESNAGINKPEAVAEAVDQAVRALEIEVQTEDRELADPSEDRMQIAALRFLNRQGEAERRMQGRLRAIFSRMQKAVIQGVKEGKRSAPVYRAALADLAIILDSFNDEIAAVLQDEAERSFGEGFDDFSADIASAVSPELLIDFALISEEVTAWAATDAATKITTISETLHNEVRDILQLSLEEGESIDGLTARLGKFFDDNKGFKAETIARTETANAYNFGKYTNAEAFDQANPTLQVTKTWTPTQDQRTREAHRPGAIENVQGEKKRTVLREEPFVVGGERMMRPLDPAGSAGNVIRCRCVMTFDVKGE
jgi:HK97 family phage portal protein